MPIFALFQPNMSKNDNKTHWLRKEAAILQKAMQSGESEMVAILGRRRVGKTFLIRSVFAEKIRFEITGLQNTPR